MRYTGTRSDDDVSFEHVILSGFAPHGGLFVPKTLPDLTNELAKWKNFTYKELLFVVVRYFVDIEEIPSKDLLAMIDRAFLKFNNKDIVGMFKNDYTIMELFHGPTNSFKDYALSLLAQFIEFFLEKRNKTTTILVGTSGDTGSAAIHSVMDLKRVNIICLYPKDRCSKVQELQMTTINKPNVHLYRVEGTSDDLDVPIKQIFDDVEFSAKYNVSSINSINWARIMIQTVHFFYAYLQTGCKYVSVPTGASGNLASGYLSILMGLPIKLIACVNQNDIIYHCMQTGEYRIEKSVHKTLSPSMDIQVPYNWERIMYFANGQKSMIDLMSVFESKKKVTIPNEILDKLRVHISSRLVTDVDTKAEMKKYYESTGYILDPHSCVGVCGARGVTDNAVCIATASPCKFPEITLEILGIVVNELEIELSKEKTHFMEMKEGEDWLASLKEKIVSIN